jgi:CHASE3 domain sensor protein
LYHDPATMKITTRIISGCLLFAAVLTGLLAYSIVSIQRMRTISKTLAEKHLQDTLVCLTAIDDLESVAESAKRLAAVGDLSAGSDDRRQFQEAWAAFQKRLAELKTRAVTDKQQTEVKRLAQDWDACAANLASLWEGSPQGALSHALNEDLKRLNMQARTVYQAYLQSMSRAIESSGKAADAAMRILWVGAFAALAICLPASLLIVRSISKPFKLLLDGTRTIAGGRSSWTALVKMSSRSSPSRSTEWPCA